MEQMPLARIQQRMSELKEWSLEGNSIAKEIQFKSFKEAIEFVNKVALLSEEKAHHPDILISYDKLRIVLTTHEENGITEKDFEMAKAIDNLV